MASLVAVDDAFLSPSSSAHNFWIDRAEQKRAALIVLPFHKILWFDGSMDSVGHGYQLVNQRVLQHAPCSVGVLIDHGLGGSAQVCASEVSYTFVVLYFGGCDDREALAYGVRMEEHLGIELTVMHFVPQPGQPFVKPTAEGSVGRATNASEQLADETCITDFQAFPPSSPPFLRNKLAQALAVLIRLEYPALWPSVFLHLLPRLPSADSPVSSPPSTMTSSARTTPASPTRPSFGSPLEKGDIFCRLIQVDLDRLISNQTI